LFTVKHKRRVRCYTSEILIRIRDIKDYMLIINMNIYFNTVLAAKNLFMQRKSNNVGTLNDKISINSRKIGNKFDVQKTSAIEHGAFSIWQKLACFATDFADSVPPVSITYWSGRYCNLLVTWQLGFFFLYFLYLPFPFCTVNGERTKITSKTTNSSHLLCFPILFKLLLPRINSQLLFLKILNQS